MTIFEDIQNALRDAGNNLATQAARFRNRTTMEAVVAGCAVIAYADGNVSAEEKQKMIGFMTRNEAMKVFKVPEVVDAFNKIISTFEFDATIGKGEALSLVSRLRGNADASQLLIRLCIAIGMSDGNFDNNEKQAVREICSTLNVAASEFGL